MLKNRTVRAQHNIPELVGAEHERAAAEECPDNVRAGVSVGVARADGHERDARVHGTEKRRRTAGGTAVVANL